MDYYRQPDRGSVSERICQVRRRAGLSQIEFARKLRTNIMIVEIAEHGIMEANGQMSSLYNIPMRDLVNLVTSISRIFHVSQNWLMYGINPTEDMDEYSRKPKDELTLYLPVTISSQGLVDEMNRTLALVDTNPKRSEELCDLKLEYFKSIILKQRLYEQYALQCGITSCACISRKKMLNAVEKLKL